MLSLSFVNKHKGQEEDRSFEGKFTRFTFMSFFSGPNITSVLPQSGFSSKVFLFICKTDRDPLNPACEKFVQ